MLEFIRKMALNGITLSFEKERNPHTGIYGVSVRVGHENRIYGKMVPITDEDSEETIMKKISKVVKELFGGNR